MKLEDLLGAELYKTVQEKIDTANANVSDKLKHVRYADLSEGAYISKDKFDALETDKGNLAQQLEASTQLIEKLKNSTKDNDLQTKISNYETQIADLQTENTNIKTETALKLALLDAGANPADMEYLIFKAKSNGEIKLGEDGNLNKQEELVSNLKTTCQAHFIANAQKQIKENTITGKNDNASLSKMDILKKSYSERMELYNQDPQAFNEIMNK